MYKFLNKRGLSGYVNEMTALPQPTLDRIGEEKEKSGRGSFVDHCQYIHHPFFLFQKDIWGSLS